MSRAASSAASELPGHDLPDDLPGANDIVRILFAGRDGDALELLVGDTLVYVLPWAARHGGVAGYVQDAETYAVWPVEFTVDDVERLLAEHRPHEVSLLKTPAWLLSPRKTGPPVTWHARVRWAQRVEPMADPGPRIREAWQNGLQIGVSRGYGRYDPATNVVVCYNGSTYDDPAAITTVYPLDESADIHDHGLDHLKRCDVCDGLWNPLEADVCRHCSVPPARPHRPRLPAGGEENR